MNKHVKKLFYRPFWCLATVFVAILLAILFVGESIAMGYAGWINSYLGIEETIKVDDSNNETPDVLYYKPDYFMQYRWHWDETAGKDGNGGYVFQTKWNKDGLYTYLKDVIKRVDTEGSVLLKNDNSALPYQQGTTISLYGISQFANHYLTTGQGSGFHAANTSDTLKNCLQSYGLAVNTELYEEYEKVAQKHNANMFNSPTAGDFNCIEYEVDEASFSEIATISDNTTGAGKSDSALFILTRWGSENGDTNFNAAGHVDNNYLDLTTEEISILDKLVEYKNEGKIQNIVLLLNTCTPIQFKTLSKYDIDSILWVGTGGTSSYRAIAEVLSGAADPNGRLADIYAYDNYSAPSTVNTGNFTYSDASGVPATEQYAHSDKYIVYQEGIYVGYKYYETRYEDMVLNQGNANGTFGVKTSDGNWNYKQEVAYPFGYGGSYATFERSNFKVKEKNGTFIATIKIKNTSETYSGKDVFELYVQKPYTDYDKQNGIEKSAVELIGFAKTKKLAPGESQTLEITVDKRDLTSYDANGAGTYILEKGDYYFAYGSDSHDALNNIIARKGAVNASLQDSAGDKDFSWCYQQDEDDFTTYATSKNGTTIENQFDDVDLNRYENTTDQKITYLSRSNWANTYPVKAISLNLKNSAMLSDMQYGKEIPETDEAMPTYGADNGLSLIDLMYEEWDSPLWDQLLDQLTFSEQMDLTLLGANIIGGASSIAAPGGLVQDGPAGIRGAEGSVAYSGETIMACTYNTDLIEELGEAFGMEMQYMGFVGLYGPGANIHRNAFGGRNFEYFSEDGVLSGYMLDAELKGLSKMGIITYTKHLALNEQERNRYGASVWANEQSIREIYLKAFQISIENETYETVGIMTSLNRLGCTWVGRHAGLLTNVLRKEWGFKGSTMTDAAVGGYMGVNGNTLALANAVVAGQSIWLSDVRQQGFGEYKDNPTVANAIRQACKENLYAKLRSSSMNGMKSGTKIVKVTPWWVAALNTAEIVVSLITALCVGMTVASFVLAHKDKKMRKGQA